VESRGCAGVDGREEMGSGKGVVGGDELGGRPDKRGLRRRRWMCWKEESSGVDAMTAGFSWGDLTGRGGDGVTQVRWMQVERRDERAGSRGGGAR